MAWLHAVIDVPEGRHADMARFYEQVLGWPLGTPWPRHPELVSFAPPDGGPYVHLQRVDGAARVHLGLEAADPGASVSRAIGLGATLVAELDRWSTLRSPLDCRSVCLPRGSTSCPTP